MQLYFAYGSNLCASRLISRAPSARFVAIGRLTGHALRFHKRGRDGSAKADADAVGSSDVVWGALAEITTDDVIRLDGFEPGYDRERQYIEVDNGASRAAWVYRARPEYRQPDLLPLGWYVEHILVGGRARGLPDDYLAQIAAAPVADATPAVAVQDC